MKSYILCGILILLVSCSAPEKDPGVPIFVNPPCATSSYIPVHAIVDLPNEMAQIPVEQIKAVLRREGQEVAGQLVAGENGKAELWWILPKAIYGKGGNWKAYFEKKTALDVGGFVWKDVKGEYADLLYNNKKKIRYMYAFEKDDPIKALKTYKPYLHVFDEKGENFITKGPGGKYTHHRGLFIGWNKLKSKGKEYDFWHMKGVVQKHKKFVQQIAGPVLAKSSCLIHWLDDNNEAVLAEGREMVVFRQQDPTLILLEFRTILHAVMDDVHLDGDPEHAGFQYRAHNDVAEGEGAVYESAKYLFHKEGIDPLKDKDLPWVGLNYKLFDSQYTVQHMNHPENPKPNYYSAYRAYGRFGAFFKARIKKGESLALAYRVAVKTGAMPDRKEMEDRYKLFVNPPRAGVVVNVDED